MVGWTIPSPTEGLRAPGPPPVHIHNHMKNGTTKDKEKEKKEGLYAAEIINISLKRRGDGHRTT